MKILKLWNVKFIMNQKCVEGKEPMKFMWQFQLSIFLSVVEPFKIFNLGNINNLLTHGYWLQTLWYIQRQFTSGATVWMIIWFTKERGWVNKSCCVHWTSQKKWVSKSYKNLGNKSAVPPFQILLSQSHKMQIWAKSISSFTG